MTSSLHRSIDLDSRAIRRVEPFSDVADVEGWHWPCTRCSRRFPVSASYAVVFDSAGRRLRFVVCDDCAPRYQIPRPVTVDLDRCPPPDRAPRDVKMLAAHAWFVSNARSKRPGRILWLRDADVRKLAAESNRTPAELVEQLEIRGVLAST